MFTDSLEILFGLMLCLNTHFSAAFFVFWVFWGFGVGGVSEWES